LFTARRHARAVYALLMCLPVTSPCCTDTAKRKIIQTSPRDRDATFPDTKGLGKTETGPPLTKAPNAGGLGKNWRLSTNQ